MNKLSRILCRLPGLASASLCLVLAYAALGWSQQRPLSTPSTAIDQADSRAEKEAEQMVSLSADNIIALLRQETGLLLQVKKAVVRKAFEQGRIVDPADLTDDGLFTLIREDENTRVIATHEIQDRYYIQAKPTREEMVRSIPCRESTASDLQTSSAASKVQTPSTTQSTQSGGAMETFQPIPSQEEIYWEKHENDLDCYSLQNAPYDLLESLYRQLQSAQMPYGQFPSSQYPQQPTAQPQYPQQQYPQPQYPQQYPPSQSTPQNQQVNPLRQLQMTQMQAPWGNYFENNESDENETAQIQGAGLSGMLSAGQMGALSSVSRNEPGGMGGSEAESSSPFGSATPSIGSLSSLGSLGSLLQGQQGNSQGLSQQPSLQNLAMMQPSLQLPTYPAPPLQPMLHHRPNPYADVPSLYDLYAQYSRHSPLPLERFGEDVFRDGTGNFDLLPMDVPVGPEYVVYPGDGLTVDIWGGISQRLERVVDRSGRIDLPEVGTVDVAGRNLGDVQHMIQTVLRGQFRNVNADVSLSRLRTVRIYVVGDVERPGGYDISSLSTPLNALYAAGGPTSAGSLRILNHYRGKDLVQQVDVYDLLLHGIRGDMQRMQPGDTIQVPPLGAEVTVEGMVRRPAIYELNHEKNLAEVLELAGGVMPTGTLRHVDVERVETHDSRTMLRLDIPENNNQEAVTQALDDFKVQDGDKIKITPILPYADKTVYLDGYVSRPGKFAYREGMRVTDLIRSYKDLLPEPSVSHAEIIRLNPPDFTPVVLAFNLGDAMAGKNADPILKPFDTVRIFGRYDFEDPPVITVTGEVRDPGDHLTNGAAHLRDAVYLAGGTTPDALLDDAQVFRKTKDGKLRVISVNLAKALKGDAKDNIVLEPKDRVFVHRDLNKLDPAVVTVEGEVGRPGKYPLGENMSAAGLVRLAGGFRRGAYTEEADLTRYEVEEGTKVISDHVDVPIAKAMAGVPDTDVRLRDGDVLTIRQITGWKDLGATIKVSGEVVHPGTYGIQEGEKLSSIIARAGGLRSDAYPYGTVFQRVQVRELEEKNRSDLIQRVEAEEGDIKLLPGMDTDQMETAKAATLQYKTTIINLENTPPAGRLVVHLSNNVQHWANSSSDIYVRNGDEIFIPKKPNTVIVDGSVYNPTAITYRPGKSAGWYLRQAGGPTEMANKRAVFVVRADGSVVGGPGGMFGGGVQSAELRPGDMVVVPEKAYSINSKWKTTLEAAQLAYAVGIAIEVSRTF
ncbi:MAG: SLBB domain-containing protein [Candidatus Sulfotelmatobacter sp.]